MEIPMSVDVLDAAKRKTLPGWIREGLEKMEREKMRKLEREKEETERRVRLSKQTEDDDPSNTKSKFVSELCAPCPVRGTDIIH